VPHTAKLSNIPVAVSNTTCEQSRERNRERKRKGEREREGLRERQ
jgi:hypothetical protein